MTSLNQRPPRAAHALALGWRLKQVLDRLAQRARIPRGDVESLFAVHEEVCEATRPAGDDRFTHRHRLGDGGDAGVELHILERHDDYAATAVEVS